MKGQFIAKLQLEVSEAWIHDSTADLNEVEGAIETDMKADSFCKGEHCNEEAIGNQSCDQATEPSDQN